MEKKLETALIAAALLLGAPLAVGAQSEFGQTGASPLNQRSSGDPSIPGSRGSGDSAEQQADEAQQSAEEAAQESQAEAQDPVVDPQDTGDEDAAESVYEPETQSGQSSESWDMSDTFRSTTP